MKPSVRSYSSLLTPMHARNSNNLVYCFLQKLACRHSRFPAERTSLRSAFTIACLFILWSHQSFAQPGAALNFASSDWVAGPVGYNATDNITYEAWVRPTALGTGYRAIVMNDNFSSAPGNVHFQFSNGQLQLAISNSGDYTSTATFNAVTWYHVAASYSKSLGEVRFYVNGALTNVVNTATPPTINGNQQFRIGSWSGDPARQFEGDIDEVRVWSTVRTAAQIAGFMNCEIGAGAPGLELSFHFNKGTAGGNNLGNTVVDESSGNFRDGNLVGFALTGPTSNYVAPGGVGTGASCGDIAYRSIATGEWDVSSTWETFNGTTWTPAIQPPGSFDGHVIIQSPHVVTMEVNRSIDQVVINAGATLQVNSGVIITNGPGHDLQNNGTAIWSGTSLLQVNAGASISGTNPIQFENTLVNNGTINIPLLASGSFGPLTIIGTGTIFSLNILNSTGVSLGGDQTITNEIDFTNGNITTGSFNKLILATTANIQGNGYLMGNMQINFPAGNHTRTYRIGDNLGLRPVDLTVSNSNGNGGVTISTINTDHPDIANSTINPIKSVNRYWTVDPGTLGSTGMRANFTWDPADVDAGSNYTNFEAKMYTNGIWFNSNTPSINATATSLNVDVLAAQVAEFQIGESAACIVNIPDAAFKNYLLSNAAINTNSDAQIQCTEAAAYNQHMYINGLGISDLTGIEAFTALPGLTCYDNSLTTLNLSSNTQLTYLFCSNNQLTSLDLSNNLLLNTLLCGQNPFTSLDLSANTAITFFNSTGMAITSLDLSAQTGLTFLVVSNSPSLSSLNIQNGNNNNLTYFEASGNPSLPCIQVDNVAYMSANWNAGKDAGADFSTDCSVSPAPWAYRSAVLNGSWTNLSTWQIQNSYNGTWLTATQAPDGSNSAAITIRNGHYISNNSQNLQADQMVIENGGTLFLAEGGLTLLDGTGDDLTVNGTIEMSGGGGLNISGQVVVNSSGVINAGSGGYLNGPGILDNAGSIHVFTNGDDFTLGAGLGLNTSNDMDWSGPGGDFMITGSGTIINNTGSLDLSGNGNIDLSGTNNIINNSASLFFNVPVNFVSNAGVNAAVNNNIGGTINVSNGITVNISQDVVLNNYGNVSVESGNTLVINNSTGVHTGNYVINGTLNGAASMNFQGTNFTVGGTVSVSNLVFIDNDHIIDGGGTIATMEMSNASAITLNSDLTISNTLTLTSGIIHTNNNKLIIGSDAGIAGGSAASYVHGTVQRYFDGTFSLPFPIGDATNYTPLSLTPVISAAGSFTANTSAGDHPNISASGINAAKSVNRTWDISEVPGVSFTSYTVDLTWVPGDVDGAANPLLFETAKYDAPGWELLTSSARTATSLTASYQGPTMSQFQIGELLNTTPGTALSFDGVDDNVVVTNSNVDLSNKSFTVEMWLKRNSTNTYDVAFSQGNSPSAAELLHIGFTADNRFGFNFFGSSYDLLVPITNDVNWHHWACTFDNSTKSRKIYRDGVLMGSDIAISAFVGNGSATRLGTNAYGGDEFDGSIDELRIWTRALSAREVQNNFSCEISSQSGLAAAYHFNQGVAAGSNATETTLTDATGNGNDGTLSGFALTGTTSNWVDPGGVTTGTVCPACIISIPDANFKSILINNPAINTNDNSEIECFEAAAFTGTILAVSAGITDMTGIEAFTGLTQMWDPLESTCRHASLSIL